MNLGKFSLSLTVKDINKSEDFYTRLGFKVIDGGHTNDGFKDTDDMKWRVLQNESVKIGLFQGMFDSNLLTFNTSELLKLQERLKSNGVQFSKEAHPEDNMPSAFLEDPDGNKIMFDGMS